MCFQSFYILSVPAEASQISVFGFSEFVTALALLFIVYTITDVRTKFRLSIAPIPIENITKWATAFIALGTLITDIWFNQGWLIAKYLSNQIIWQGLFGFIFLIIVFMWLYYAYINPPIFSAKNCEAYTQEVFRLILRGHKDELPIIAYELVPSLKNIIEYYANSDADKPVGGYAHDLLLLIGNRKFCRYVVSSSPVTAIVLFEEIALQQNTKYPITQFAQNITKEALCNKDSNLYHEDEGYTSGLMGYIKPFSKAIYGNYDVVQNSISNLSPLDVDYMDVKAWDAQQLKAYTRIVTLFSESYFNKIRESGNRHSTVFVRSLENIQNACSDIYKLNDLKSDIYSSDITYKLSVAVDFVRELIVLLDEKPMPKMQVRRLGKNYQTQKNLYDFIADLIFGIILSASALDKNIDSWHMHYSLVWSKFFVIYDDTKPARLIVLRKLRRLLYEEIARMDDIPNFKGAKILGYCLNVMGFETDIIKDKMAKPLHKWVLNWTKKNYLWIRKDYPFVAKACLMGTISFDDKNSRLVKTYIRGLSKVPPKSYLALQKSTLTRKKKTRKKRK